jgi:hypothetical protein
MLGLTPTIKMYMAPEIHSKRVRNVRYGEADTVFSSGIKGTGYWDTDK